MAERRIGLIPNATTMARVGQDETCKILVTDRRLILTFDGPKNSLRRGFKGIFGKEADEPPVPPEEIDFEKVDIDKLARMNDNIVIPYFSMDRFKIDSMLGVYSLGVSYKNEQEKKLWVDAILAPPEALIRLRRADGVGRREIIKQYGQKCQDLLKRALAQSTSLNVEWKE